MGLELIDFGYLVGALLFVLGLRNLSSPDTARKGNLMSAAGMGIAIILTLFYPLENDNGNFLWVGIGMVLGGILGF
jgi:NAD(P) transhydrogenase subunit beta